MTTLYIYVLKLKSEKYYIGSTTNPQVRIDQHTEGSGSAWTRKYQPVDIVEVFAGDSYDEDKTTRKYMSQYGIDNVRGGTYVQIKLSASDREHLTRELRMTAGVCMRCGRKGHFVADCYAKTSGDGGEIIGASTVPTRDATKQKIPATNVVTPSPEVVTSEVTVVNLASPEVVASPVTPTAISPQVVTPTVVTPPVTPPAQESAPVSEFVRDVEQLAIAAGSIFGKISSWF